MKQAILVVSFGTTHLDTLEHNIARLEQSVAEQFPGAQVFRAFTSSIVRRRLKEQQGIRVPSVEEAMEQLCADGFGEVTVQPSLLIPGVEYDRLREELRPFADRISVSLGRPLLWEEADLDRMTALLREAFAPQPDTVLLMMGHGTDHPANDRYVRLARKLREVPGCTMRLCTVEGVPTFADAVEELKTQPLRKVLAAPLMLVAGDHAKNDMDGSEAGSLRTMLEAEGFTVTCRIQGLGQLEAVRALYVQRIRQAQPI